MRLVRSFNRPSIVGQISPASQLARTSDRTVMSGGITIGFVDIAPFSFDLDRVRCASFASFLVRNWCGSTNDF